MIKVSRTESFIKQQADCLDILTELIAFDKQHGNPPETARVLEGFIDTQRRALDMAKKLLEKHKPALENIEKEEREKQQAQAKIETAKRKEEHKKEQAEKDLKKAETDENSLFCCTDNADEEEPEETNDEYGFEEMDDDE